MDIKKWGKNKVIIAIVAAVLILAGLVIFIRKDGGAFFGENKVIENPNVQAGEVEVLGKLACLPYKPDSPAIDESCVLGVNGVDGKTYAINTKSKVDGDVGDDVRVVGKYTSINTTAEEAAVFSYDGVIDVRFYKKL